MKDLSQVQTNLISKNSELLSNIEGISTINFGSCNHEDDPQTIWSEIIKNDPDLWIWMGDNVYGDGGDMSLLKKTYTIQKQNELYQNFIAKTPVIGTWDDHDYGQNDGNKTFMNKERSKSLMLNFLDVPQNNTVRSREGVYQSYIFGKENKKVKVLLLDTRTFQDKLKKNPAKNIRYLPSEGEILGQQQWDWLKKELLKKDAQLNIIVTSIQFIAEDHGFEKWANFPNERQRMLDMLIINNIENVLFLSGDRHIAEISKLDVAGLSYPVYDITSSGLTHSYEKANESNSHRISPLVPYKNYGQLSFDWNHENKVIVKAKVKGTKGEVYINELFEYFL